MYSAEKRIQIITATINQRENERKKCGLQELFTNGCTSNRHRQKQESQAAGKGRRSEEVPNLSFTTTAKSS